MQQAIATVQSAAAFMRTFALETQDQNAKYHLEISSNFDGALNTLKERQKYLERQEPQ